MKKRLVLEKQIIRNLKSCDLSLVAAGARPLADTEYPTCGGSVLCHTK